MPRLPEKMSAILKEQTKFIMKIFLIITSLCMNIISIGVQADDFVRQRQRMIHDIEDMVAHTESYIGKSELDMRVMTAMVKVPRHEFVPDEFQSHAYINSALPITHGQTISQPYIVALMTDLAKVNEQSRVLEVGTGSGYQAAILAELINHVYTIEIIEPLGLQAKKKLLHLGYDNISVKIGDGYHGWPEHAPFDAILVTAGAESVPLPLIEQLKPGGRLVIPIGPHHATQTLTVIEKNTDGKITQHNILPVGFVPLTREQ
jgi:protein-L-isoaspartate(D-aspartate) O-methyltransferase